jgi:ATP-binding cassette, subfamily B, bacterial
MSGGSRVLRPYVLRQWRALAGAGAASGVLAAADLAKPWPLALIVDHIFTHRTPPFRLGEEDIELLAGVTALILAISVAESLANYFADLWLQSAGERITHELRVAIYDHLQRLSLAFHQRSQKGDLLTRVTGDVSAMGNLFSDTLGEMVQSALLSIGMTAVLIWIDPVLALFGLVTAPLLVTLSWVFRRRVRERARRQRRHEGDLASVANEALSAMAVVKAFGAETLEAERVRSRSEQRMGAGVEVARLQAGFDGTVGVLRALSTALVTIAGVVRVAHGDLSPGDLIVFVSYTRKAHSPMRSFAREASKLTAALARADRVAEILSEDEVLEERPDAYAGPRARGDVELDGVSFAYAGERPALDGVNLRIPAGKRVALTGASGAGKSTLSALVARFYDPTDGRVTIDGRDTRDCSLAWLRRQVAVVLQDTVLFSGTVRENIAYGTDATPAEIEDAAKAAAAHDFIRALPKGYDTELGPQGVGLSGGQRQRIGIARTLLRNPPIIVLDEPTTALDREAEAQVLAGLDRLMRGRTCLLITHSPRLARTADEIVELAGGQIVDRRAPKRPRLPQLERLLDPATAGRILARSRDTEPREARIVRVAFKPDERLDVHVRAAAGEAVITAEPGADLPAQVRAWNRREATYDADEDVLVTWLPFDPRLPGLSAHPDGLARRLALDEPGEPRLTRYKPRGRAVLRWGDHVLKAYGHRGQFEAAVAGLRAAPHTPLPTAAFEAALPDLRLTMQRAVPGELPPDARAVAGEAGEAVAALQRTTLDRLEAAPPERQLASARHKAQLIAAVAPELRTLTEPLTHRLESTLPRTQPLRPAHGDFHADQLLVGQDHLSVVDFDSLCLAPAALDLATYAADVVRGRPEDNDTLHAVLEPLLAGYGTRPEALEWHLATAILTRAAHPFHRQAPGWRERMEAMVTIAEATLG